VCVPCGGAKRVSGPMERARRLGVAWQCTAARARWVCRTRLIDVKLGFQVDGRPQGGVEKEREGCPTGRTRAPRGVCGDKFFLLQCGRRERARSCAEKTDQSLSTHASFHGARNAVQRPSTRLFEHQTVTHTILVQAQHAQQSKWRTASPQPARRPPMRAPPPPGPAPPSSRRGPPRYEMTGVACEEAASVRPCASRMRRWVVTSRGTAPSGLTRG